jgi:Flp pilus assembly protein protease CpaA
MAAAGGLIGLVLLIKRKRQQPAMASATPAPAALSAADTTLAAAHTAETPTAEAPRPTRKSHIPYGVGIAIAGLDFFLVSPHSPFAPFWPWMQ